MHIEVVERDRSLILRVEGELDIATAPSLDTQLERAQMLDVTTIVVDLDEVGFIDSSGLEVLIRHAALSSSDGGRLRLTKGSAQAQRLFELTGTSDRLPFIES